MFLCPNYSRTLRVGELYESALFAKVADGEGGDGRERWLNRLKIQPMDEDPDFDSKIDNWKRYAKVPNLILNATTLNTGHNWHFTASWMGEPPGGINTKVDANYRLRRVYHDSGRVRICRAK